VASDPPFLHDVTPDWIGHTTRGRANFEA
jgi:hypothetical protein